jgi:hypothetical protein
MGGLSPLRTSRAPGTPRDSPHLMTDRQSRTGRTAPRQPLHSRHMAGHPAAAASSSRHRVQIGRSSSYVPLQPESTVQTITTQVGRLAPRGGTADYRRGLQPRRRLGLPPPSAPERQTVAHHRQLRQFDLAAGELELSRGRVRLAQHGRAPGGWPASAGSSHERCTLPQPGPVRRPAARPCPCGRCGDSPFQITDRPLAQARLRQLLLRQAASARSCRSIPANLVLAAPPSHGPRNPPAPMARHGTRAQEPAQTRSPSHRASTS